MQEITISRYWTTSRLKLWAKLGSWEADGELVAPEAFFLKIIPQSREESVNEGMAVYPHWRKISHCNLWVEYEEARGETDRQRPRNLHGIPCAGVVSYRHQQKATQVLILR